MSANAILSDDLVALGLYIEEDDNYIYLKHKDKVIGQWWKPSARLVAIRTVAQSWAQRHRKEIASVGCSENWIWLKFVADSAGGKVEHHRQEVNPDGVSNI